jgi:predicted phosphodiesterase
MTDRLLVMGDNHGDTESLRRVLDDVEDETFDFAVHVGDFTRAWRQSREFDDEQTGKERGVEQLRAVEPILAEIEPRTRHGLLWVYGNQDYFGDLGYDLDVGTEIPDDDCLTVGGQRFTNSPARVESDVVLVTHVEKWSLLDHFDGKAHLCGNTHRGRYRGRRLNSAFLQVRNPETGAKTFGGYFVVELGDDTFDVEMRSIGSLERRECDRHRERGVQFQPASRDCMYCRDQRNLMREMCASAFFGLTSDSTRDSVTEGELVEYAAGLWNDPPSGFRTDFGGYLADVDADRYAPLTRTDEGRLTLAERSYAY